MQVTTCFACGSELGEGDRFCGHCGASQAAGARLSVGTKKRWPVRYGLAVLVLALLAGGSFEAYRLFTGAEPGPVVRFAIDGIGGADQSAASEQPSDDASEPAESESEAAESQAPEEEEQLASATPANDATLIQPGNWLMTIQLIGVAKANPSDNSFELNRQGIGSSESSSICVNPAIAANPGSAAFPFPPGMRCSASNFTMADGAYRSGLTCNFPQFGGRLPVSASGRYSKDSVALEVNVRTRAQVVRGDFDQPPEIVLQYRLMGNLAGPC